MLSTDCQDVCCGVGPKSEMLYILRIFKYPQDKIGQLQYGVHHCSRKGANNNMVELMIEYVPKGSISAGLMMKPVVVG